MSTKVVQDRRLVWFANTPDEVYWHKHWAAKVRPDYYAQADTAALERSELGRLLLSTFDRSGRLLEAGCGAGWWVAALTSAGFDVDGIEFSESLVEAVQRVAPELAVRHGDATNLDAPDESYSSYLSLGVVEHVRSGPEPFLEEAWRLLEPGGRAVITVPAFGPLRRLKGRLGLFDDKPEPSATTLSFYQYGFCGDEFARLVAGAGFRVDHLSHIGLHRMLSEELPLYEKLVQRRGGERLLRHPLARVVGERDGHMVCVVATKPI